MGNVVYTKVRKYAIVENVYVSDNRRHLDASLQQMVYSTGHSTPWKMEMANAIGMTISYRSTFHLSVHTGNFIFYFFQKVNFYWTLSHKGDYFLHQKKNENST
jgi:hypothetical protein